MTSNKKTLNSSQVSNLAEEFQTKHPKDIIRKALESIDNIAIAFSGAEDVAIIDMAYKINKNINVFCIDTGRLNPATYQFIDRVRQHYDLNIEFLFPDAEDVQTLVNKKGLFSFYQDGHNECCGIRKVAPMRKKLANLDGWISGQRRDQSPSTRSELSVIEIDRTFSTVDKSLIKVNPLANWSSQQTWEYIRMFDVPYNLLHDKGFISIGCEPCTKALGPNQHEREGRWWWEEATAKECGLHIKGL